MTVLAAGIGAVFRIIAGDLVLGGGSGGGFVFRAQQGAESDEDEGKTEVFHGGEIATRGAAAADDRASGATATQRESASQGKAGEEERPRRRLGHGGGIEREDQLTAVRAEGPLIQAEHEVVG